MDKLVLNINNLMYSFNTELPIYVDSVLILIIGLIIAKLIYLSIAGILKITKFDAAAEKIGFLELITNHISDVPSRIIAKICYWIIITITLCVIVDNFGFEDISLILWSIIKLLSQLISFAAFIVINYYILNFFAKIFRICLALINFKYYRLAEWLFLVSGGFGIIFYSLPLLGINEQTFLNGSIFIAKCSIISISIIMVIGFRDVFYNIYLHFIIKSVYKIGNHIYINEQLFVINRINLFSLVLLSPESEIVIDNKKFYENIIKKR
ncbi:hypothetical protein KA977_10355 [Candidatus Dependentiae bacterium]|nr:hypothetical protein [Candidatus Dependentiae bacterium]